MGLTPGQIVNTLTKAGLTKTAAAGIAGNAMQESTDNPGDAGGNLLQWQGSRQTGLQSYASSHGLNPNSAAANLGYLVQDLNGSYKGLKGQLNAAKTPAEAATLFSNIYERPGTPMLGNRIKYAQEALNASGGALPLSPSATATSSGSSALKQLSNRTVSKTTTQFDQAGFNAAKANSIAGQYLAGQSANPWAVAAPKTGLTATPASNPLLTAGVLSTTAPNPADYQSVHTTLQKVAGTTLVPHPSTLGVKQTTTVGGPVNTKVKGVTVFAGKQVADWIAPILAYAKAHGWTGTVNSGYRSYAEQKAIYDSGVRPAAVPGTSNHEGSQWPAGAVDVSNASQLSAILAKSPYAKALVWAGSKDPVHFSHPHNGSY